MTEREEAIEVAKEIMEKAKIKYPGDVVYLAGAEVAFCLRYVKLSDWKAIWETAKEQYWKAE